ncbi:hypothetical protein BKA65DRAFT_20879 [Rhexocercosporidium sp. MPI-PUGE-AT-0058]|nr:hypothetical protein BKA65DRAFT_20879 [Rhexocercosporidium sp. MPI-PUGE-AT-0058]
MQLNGHIHPHLTSIQASCFPQHPDYCIHLEGMKRWTACMAVQTAKYSHTTPQLASRPSQHRRHLLQKSRIQSRTRGYFQPPFIQPVHPYFKQSGVLHSQSKPQIFHVTRFHVTSPRVQQVSVYPITFSWIYETSSSHLRITIHEKGCLYDSSDMRSVSISQQMRKAALNRPGMIEISARLLNTEPNHTTSLSALTSVSEIYTLIKLCFSTPTLIHTHFPKSSLRIEPAI